MCVKSRDLPAWSEVTAPTSHCGSVLKQYFVHFWNDHILRHMWIVVGFLLFLPSKGIVHSKSGDGMIVATMRNISAYKFLATYDLAYEESRGVRGLH